jgi:hypothetical protein
MKTENEENARHTVPMSPNAHQNIPPNSAAFLKRQQAEAQVAISKTVRALKRDLVAAIDPQTWVKISPWATIGIAAVSGFTAAAVVVPGRQHPVPPANGVPPGPPDPSATAPPSPPKTSGAVWAAVSTGLYGLARIALTEIVSSAMRGEPVTEPLEREPDLDMAV